MKLKFTVTGMTCAACSARVEKVTRQVPGVDKADVNLLGGSMVVEAADAAVANSIIKAVTAAGYGAALAGEKNKKQEKHHVSFADAVNDVPHAFPAAMRAQKIGKRAA